MFGGLFKKDFKLMLKSSSTIVMVVVIPLLIILIFGFTMKNYMNCNFGTFDDSKVLYFTDNASVEMMDLQIFLQKSVKRRVLNLKRLLIMTKQKNQ